QVHARTSCDAPKDRHAGHAPRTRLVRGPRRLELGRAGRGRPLVLVSGPPGPRHRRRRLARALDRPVVRWPGRAQCRLVRLPGPAARHAARRLNTAMDALTAFLAEYWPHVTALASLGIGAA